MRNEIKLPRAIESDERYEEIKKILDSSLKKVNKNSHLKAVFLNGTPRFINALQLEQKRGRIIRGLENIQRNLDIQANGIALADEKAGTVRSARVSRLIIISNDGSDRFLRKLENLLEEHDDRVLPIILNSDSEELCAMFFGADKTAKVIMLAHKESVCNALLALLPKA